MPFTLRPEVGAALGAMFGAEPPPPLPVGDVHGRRERLNAMGAALQQIGAMVSDVTTKDFHTPASDGHQVLCRWYTKNSHPAPGSAVVYAHGGGYIGFDVTAYDAQVKRYVSRTGVPFLSVDYRLAPEARAPTQVTDVYAGLEYLHAHAKDLGVDPQRIAIMGDSAGGGITASLAHYVKQKGGPRVCKQILVYPMLDDRNAEADGEIEPMASWGINDNKTGWGAALGDQVGSDSVGPVQAAGRMTVEDAKGLPPTYIDVGELDYFRDEDLEYARKLGKAGVECELHLFPQLNHAAQEFAPEMEVARLTADLRANVLKKL